MLLGGEHERSFNDGEIVFREGDPSETVGLVVAGAVEVVKGANGHTVVLARLGPGELVGEMGVLEARCRGATVRAVGDTVLRLMSRDAFLERVSTDRRMALDILHVLSERLHRTDERIAGNGRALQVVPPSRRVAGGATLTAVRSVRLLPGSRALERVLPPEGVAVERFPFAVGRKVGRNERAPAVAVDLAIEDERPYRLSRLHFSLTQTPKGPAVSDTMSRLGTAVNGEYLGEQFTNMRVLLRPGENKIIAGGLDSPYVFRVVVG